MEVFRRLRLCSHWHKCTLVFYPIILYPFISRLFTGQKVFTINVGVLSIVGSGQKVFDISRVGSGQVKWLPHFTEWAGSR